MDYAFPWAGCIAAFKFGGEPGLAAPLAALLRRAPGVSQALPAIDLAVPMPLSHERLAERGYNQAHEIARRLVPGRVRTDLLLRLRHTGAQSERSLPERWRNVAGAFAVDPLRVAQVRGLRLALVDDVMTTGASAAACCTALLAAGAASVAVFVLARTPEPVGD